jgi:hypothetical protein
MNKISTPAVMELFITAGVLIFNSKICYSKSNLPV